MSAETRGLEGAAERARSERLRAGRRFDVALREARAGASRSAEAGRAGAGAGAGMGAGAGAGMGPRGAAGSGGVAAGAGGARGTRAGAGDRGGAREVGGESGRGVEADEGRASTLEAGPAAWLARVATPRGARPRREDAPAREATAVAERAEAPAASGPREGEGAPAPEAELRAAVRALPAAVEAARLAGGAQVTLELGAALGVDVSSGARGLDVTLRPRAELGRAALAELPALVSALRARGLAVARAEVRPRAEAGSGAGLARVRAR